MPLRGLRMEFGAVVKQLLGVFERLLFNFDVQSISFQFYFVSVGNRAVLATPTGLICAPSFHRRPAVLSVLFQEPASVRPVHSVLTAQGDHTAIIGWDVMQTRSVGFLR